MDSVKTFLRGHSEPPRQTEDSTEVTQGWQIQLSKLSTMGNALLHPLKCEIVTCSPVVYSIRAPRSLSSLGAASVANPKNPHDDLAPVRRSKGGPVQVIGGR